MHLFPEKLVSFSPALEERNTWVPLIAARKLINEFEEDYRNHRKVFTLCECHDGKVYHEKLRLMHLKVRIFGCGKCGNWSVFESNV
jgi:hypothetical protein